MSVVVVGSGDFGAYHQNAYRAYNETQSDTVGHGKQRTPDEVRVRVPDRSAKQR